MKNYTVIMRALPCLLIIAVMIFVLGGYVTEHVDVSTDPTTVPTETTASTADITDPTDSSLSQNAWTTVDAVLVNDQGEVVETMELSISVMTWEQEGRGFYNLRFFYPENIHNSGGGVLPYPDEEITYTCSSGSGVEKGPEGKHAAAYYVGFDAEHECFIVDFDDGEDVYLIAHWGTEEDISVLWDHFQDFIAMRPDSFPMVS